MQTEYTPSNPNILPPIPEVCPCCGHSPLLCEDKLTTMAIAIGELQGEVEYLRERCGPESYDQRCSDLLDGIALVEAMLADVKKVAQEVVWRALA